jgi:hypothetical protein
MNSEDIDVIAEDPPTDDPLGPVPKPTTDDYDIFQGDVMLYSQLMIQMSIDPCASLYHISGPSTRVLETQPDDVERHK